MAGRGGRLTPATAASVHGHAAPPYRPMTVKDMPECLGSPGNRHPPTTMEETEPDDHGSTDAKCPECGVELYL